MKFNLNYNNILFEFSLKSLNKQSVVFFASLIISMLVSSCKGFIDIDPPKKQLVTESVFAKNETANSAMLNIYSSMVSSIGLASPYNISLYTAISADELRTYSNTMTIQQLYANSIDPTSAATNNIWSVAYFNIYKSNAIIEGCGSSSTISKDVKVQLVGEARFVRAFWHFYLVNSFGDVPLILSTDYIENSKIGRSKKSVVYGQIIDDLLAAESTLNEGYVGQNGVTIINERVRPNKAAATALLGRVYLYVERYAEAEEQATKLIDNKFSYGLVSLDSVFLKNNREAIWQLMVTTPNTSNTSEGLGFVLTAKPSIGLVNSSTISPQLMEAFEVNDKRKISWISKFTDITVVPNVIYNYPNKYKVKSATTITEYSTVLRLGEQYLIRAEARTKLDKLGKAIEDLDVVRKRAGLTLISETDPNISKGDLLNAIARERRVELFTEWGHRWYDLKRTGAVDSIMLKASVDKGSVWISTKQLWPIPPQDILNNRNLGQNLGYN